MNSPALGLLLDIDGPIASPVTRTVAIDSIARDLVALANAGNPVVFNTGRSDAFVVDVVLPALTRHGLAAHAPVSAVCEKGATWLSLAGGVASAVEVDEALRLPAELAAEIRELVAGRFSEEMFFDETKRTMISVEQRVDVDPVRYGVARERFDAAARAAVEARGLGGSIRLDPTIISTDIEHRDVGKDVGAARAIELVSAGGAVPRRWRTAGDSRGDYAMADWLHEQGYLVQHLDVRPADGVPSTPYLVLTHDELIHDDATAEFLGAWREEFAA